MRKLKLLQTHNITFKRIGSDSEKPYVNEYGEVVQPSSVAYIATEGSWQPKSRRNDRINTPAGVEEENHAAYWTTTELRTTDQYGNNMADTCTVDGLEYKVTRKGNWTGYGLTPDHYEYFLKLTKPFPVTGD